jgi:hypothetical protein
MATPDMAEKARDIISILQCTCLKERFRSGSVIMMIVKNSLISNSALEHEANFQLTSTTMLM